MPLTPADVHNVAFSKPPIGKRGYNEDEVDQFLDLVELELTRLVEENSDLALRVSELEAELGQAKQAGVTAAPAAAPAFVKPEPVKVVETPAPAPTPAPAVAVADESGHLQAAKLLGLAQETADRLTVDAKTESQRTIADARASSEQMVSEARGKSDTMLSEARQKAEALLADARNRSESQLKQAEDKAAALQADAEKKHAEVMGTINEQRGDLEAKIESLRTYEREYRTRLKTYLEGQLEELNQRGSAAPVDNSGADAKGTGNRK
ncbi:DivIVA-like cell division protein Wag31 [Tomitella biformata]|uniref:DivIVA-like cell division protein Wag31 n=1 Tax=Tomitella biformata TaxID=630403 RepID=UPI0004B85448|nr:DivIVA domain-containing protein [Tomitella biformata]